MKAPHTLLIGILAVAGVTGAGCTKKVAAVAPPASPKPTESTPVQRAATTPAPAQPATETAPAAAHSRQPDAATRKRIDELLARIEDVYFDYDRHTLRPDAIQALQKDSTELREILKDYPDYKLTIEGHCDERGSAEYNIALGDRRAQAAKEYLVQVGIPDQQFNLVSYGKEKQVCDEHNESCWQKNRRIHFVAAAN